MSRTINTMPYLIRRYAIEGRHVPKDWRERHTNVPWNWWRQMSFDEYLGRKQELEQAELALSASRHYSRYYDGNYRLGNRVERRKVKTLIKMGRYEDAAAFRYREGRGFWD